MARTILGKKQGDQTKNSNKKFKMHSKPFSKLADALPGQNRFLGNKYETAWGKMWRPIGDGAEAASGPVGVDPEDDEHPRGERRHDVGPRGPMAIDPAIWKNKGAGLGGAVGEGACGARRSEGCAPVRCRLLVSEAVL